MATEVPAGSELATRVARLLDLDAAPGGLFGHIVEHAADLTERDLLAGGFPPAPRREWANWALDEITRGRRVWLMRAGRLPFSTADPAGALAACVVLQEHIAQACRAPATISLERLNAGTAEALGPGLSAGDVAEWLALGRGSLLRQVTNVEDATAFLGALRLIGAAAIVEQRAEAQAMH